MPLGHKGVRRDPVMVDDWSMSGCDWVKMREGVRREEEGRMEGGGGHGEEEGGARGGGGVHNGGPQGGKKREEEEVEDMGPTRGVHKEEDKGVSFTSTDHNQLTSCMY